jgi:DNA-binding XRE family transcriptional regulator
MSDINKDLRDALDALDLVMRDYQKMHTKLTSRTHIRTAAYITAQTLLARLDGPNQRDVLPSFKGLGGMEGLTAAHTVAYLLKDARKRAGLSQTALSQRCGMRQPAIATLENNPPEGMTISSIQKYVNGCGVVVEIPFFPI